MGKYVKKTYCVSCETELSYDEKYNSRGCCPYCGYLKDGYTICVTNDKGVYVEEKSRTKGSMVGVGLGALLLVSLILFFRLCWPV